MTILNVKNLIKSFKLNSLFFEENKNYIAVNNISFDLNKGEILGFLGHNGAGKTTTIQMLLGLLTPTSGDIIYFGNHFNIDQQKVLKKIGYASGYDRLPGRLTVFENLDIVARMYDLSRKIRQERIYYLLDAFGMNHIIDKQCSGLSAGQSTCVMLAKAFIANPELVLLDEPSASLDPETAHKVREFIIKKNIEEKTSILITSHNMNEVNELCHRVLILNKGQIVANDTPQKLVQSIKKVTINLVFHECINIKLCESYLNEKNIYYNITNNILIFSIEDINIYLFLSELFKRNIIYSDIIIHKPTFEDYFLSYLEKKEKKI